MASNPNGAHRAPASPTVAVPLGASGVAGQVLGVTRIGTRAGLLVAGVLAAIVLAIVYGISSSGNHRDGATAAAQTPQILATAGPIFGNIPGADPTPPAARAQSRIVQTEQRVTRPNVQAAPVLPDVATRPALVHAADVPDIGPLQQPLQRLQSPVSSAADVAAARNAERLRQVQQIADAARHAGILVAAQPGAAVSRSAPAGGATIMPAVAEAPAANAAPSSAPADLEAEPAIAAQRAKNEFASLQKSTTADDYLTAPRQASLSPYEVQAGSIIPAILVTGINSDLPGTMIGQVSQDVYDSKTGALLLIPAGSKIVGRYDSQVTNGQSRVLVAWQRILFPDSSFIDINGMAGADTSGYAGLTGKVDDHSGKLFRNAILFSLIGAGATLLQPRTAVAALTGGVGAVVQAPSVGAQVAGQVGTQLSQAAQQSTQRGLQQQPTIEVRPGYLFNIMVDRDLVLPGPYAK